MIKQKQTNYWLFSQLDSGLTIWVSDSINLIEISLVILPIGILCLNQAVSVYFLMLLFDTVLFYVTFWHCSFLCYFSMFTFVVILSNYYCILCYFFALLLTLFLIFFHVIFYVSIILCYFLCYLFMLLFNVIFRCYFWPCCPQNYLFVTWCYF